MHLNVCLDSRGLISKVIFAILHPGGRRVVAGEGDQHQNIDYKKFVEMLQS